MSPKDLNSNKITEIYDSVILGDAVDGFCYKNLNKAFQIVMKTGCPFYSLGLGRDSTVKVHT